MAKCNGCGARIIFLTTKNEKLMPCDPDPVPFEPDPSGSMTVLNKHGEVVRAKLVVGSDSIGYVPHFVTCPAADRFRRSK